MDELIPGVPDIFREVDVLLEDWLIDAKMTPEEDWQQVSSVARHTLLRRRVPQNVTPEFRTYPAHELSDSAFLKTWLIRDYQTDLYYP